MNSIILIDKWQFNRLRFGEKCRTVKCADDRDIINYQWYVQRTDYRFVAEIVHLKYIPFTNLKWPRINLFPRLRLVAWLLRMAKYSINNLWKSLVGFISILWIYRACCCSTWQAIPYRCTPNCTNTRIHILCALTNSSLKATRWFRFLRN